MGQGMYLCDRQLPYPRLCAHRGCSAAAPENSMPAFKLAVELGAEEIEFDLWETADGQIVSLHDNTLDRISTGTGNVSDYTYEELLQFDFGVRYSEAFRGLKILRFEEILEAFGGRVIMNIHVKTPDLESPLPESYLRNIIGFIEAKHCTDSVYFMCGNDTVQRQLAKLAPQIVRCCGGGGTVERRKQIVERAVELGCRKLQFHRNFMTREMIEKAHAHGIICNVFWTDDPEEAAEFFDMGVDTILTNDFEALSEMKHQAASRLR